MIRTYLEHLSDAELAARLAQIEKTGKDTRARFDAGERGTIVGQHIERGRWCDTYSVEAALNIQRHAWKMTRLEQRRREG